MVGAKTLLAHTDSALKAMNQIRNRPKWMGFSLQNSNETKGEPEMVATRVAISTLLQEFGIDPHERRGCVFHETMAAR